MGDGEEESVGKMLEKSAGSGYLSTLVETMENRFELVSQDPVLIMTQITSFVLARGRFLIEFLPKKITVSGGWESILM